jgi:hypothetical protein
MLIPIGHENMPARRWPVITIGLIVINVVVFLFTSLFIRRLPRQRFRTKEAKAALAGGAGLSASAH